MESSCVAWLRVTAYLATFGERPALSEGFTTLSPSPSTRPAREDDQYCQRRSSESTSSSLPTFSWAWTPGSWFGAGAWSGTRWDRSLRI